MKVFFEKEYLLELYRDGKTRDKHHRYQPSIVKKYQDVIHFMLDASCLENLRSKPSLRYERLLGTKSGRSSVRINSKYRIEFTEFAEDGETNVSICLINELSNHYQ
jgi:proteic killer suppression protein